MPPAGALYGTWLDATAPAVADPDSAGSCRSLARSLLRAELSGATMTTDPQRSRFLQPPPGGTPPGRKSPSLAFAMSLVLPGAGEVYAQQYLLAAGFLALETTELYFAVSYNRRGDRATGEFEAFADAHWSAVKYSEWLNDYAKNFDGGEDRLLQIPVDPNTALPPWERVDWSMMNRVESAIPVFSHRLPRHGEQQYFELVGKYDQYSYGWDDKLENGDGWSDYRSRSARFGEYAGMRGRANDFYSAAQTMVMLVILNHVLSGIDAAWAAARYNSRLEFHSRVLLQPLRDGYAEYQPAAALTWRF